MEEYANSNMWLQQFVDILAQNDVTNISFLKSACAEPLTALPQISFVGPANCGKSTLINALTRQTLLPTGMNLDMRIPIKLEPNGDGDSVIIKNLCSGPTRLLSAEDCWTQYRCLPGDSPFRWEVGAIPSSTPWSQSVLIDTPGWNPLHADVAETYLNAEIVVCVLNAIHLFTLEDQPFLYCLKEHWASGTLFFVINWINMVPPQEEEKLFLQLHDYLQDIWKVSVDENMLNRHCFGVDAYQAECCRTHTPMVIRVGGKKLTIELPQEAEEESGIILLEDALRNAAKSTANYSPYLLKMLNRGLSDFRNQIDLRIAPYSRKISALEAQIQALAQRKKECQALQEYLDWMYQQLLETIAEKAAEVYDSFIWDIESGWEAYFSAQSIPFGVVEQARLAKIQVSYGIKAMGHALSEEEEDRRDKDIREATSALTQAVQMYIQKNLEGLDTRIALECSGIVQSYEQRIARAKGTSVHLKKEQDYFLSIFQESHSGHAMENGRDLMKQSNPQFALLSLILFQNSTLAYDSLFMDLSPEKLIAEGFYRKIYNLCVTAIFGYITGTIFLTVIAKCLWSFYRRVDDAATMGQQLLLSSKGMILSELRQNRNGFIDAFQHSLQTDMAPAYDAMMKEPSDFIRKMEAEHVSLTEQSNQVHLAQDRIRRLALNQEKQLIELINIYSKGVSYE